MKTHSGTCDPKYPVGRFDQFLQASAGGGDAAELGIGLSFRRGFRLISA